MALLAKTPLSVLLLGLPFAWLAEAQTETVYLTHVQYIYTACECFGTAPAGLSVSGLRMRRSHPALT